MTRYVLTNHGVAQAWADQHQFEARSGNGNFWFRDRTLYSYRTPIAVFVTDNAGKRVALFTCETYSVTTTGKHMGPAWRAVGYNGYRVPSLNGNHAGNLAYLVAQCEREEARLRRARVYTNLEHLARLQSDATSYALRFGLGHTLPAFAKELDNVA